MPKKHTWKMLDYASLFPFQLKNQQIAKYLVWSHTIPFPQRSLLALQAIPMTHQPC